MHVQVQLAVYLLNHGMVKALWLTANLHLTMRAKVPYIAVCLLKVLAVDYTFQQRSTAD